MLVVVCGGKEMEIPGYDYGRPTAARSPLSPAELREIEQATGWSDADAQVLRRHEQIFVHRAESMVDHWRSILGSQHPLVKSFAGPDGKRDDEYAGKVKARFVRWVVDVAQRPHDEAWLNYQEEIGLRHMPAKKNETDHGHTPPVVELRFLLAFATVVTLSARKFFIESGVTGEELESLMEAWSRAVQLHVTLWSRPYAKQDLW
ncbi:MAG TPA: protoglobin domain-containing protein [Steroidobacteraceae bacterium]|nr:protoglobin domain-containing protein [Steroidobacteraceae bacterium]